MDRTNTNHNYEIRSSEEAMTLTTIPNKSSKLVADGCCSTDVDHKKKEPNGDLMFVNKGLELWEKGRQEWLSKTKPANNKGNPKDNTSGQGVNAHVSSSGRIVQPKGAIDLNIDEVIDCIVSNRWRTALKGGKDRGTFPTPVPLPQMIDILTDLWEAEGLDN